MNANTIQYWINTMHTVNTMNTHETQKYRIQNSDNTPQILIIPTRGLTFKTDTINKFNIENKESSINKQFNKNDDNNISYWNKVMEDTYKQYPNMNK